MVAFWGMGLPKVEVGGPMKARLLFIITKNSLSWVLLVFGVIFIQAISIWSI